VAISHVQVPLAKDLVWRPQRPLGLHKETPVFNLPVAPTDVEKHNYVHRHLPLIVGSTVLSMAGVAVSMTHFGLIDPGVWVFLAFLAFTVVYFLISLRVNAFSRSFDLAAHHQLVRHWQVSTYPTIDVLLPTCGEDLRVLRQAWTHIRAMSYAGEVNVYVLDDSAVSSA